VGVVEPALLAEIVICWFPGAVARVVTVNCTEVVPADTVAVAGTVPTVALLLVSVTTNPPVGAAPVIVMVPVGEAGCVTVVGFKVRIERVGGFTTGTVTLTGPTPTGGISETLSFGILCNRSNWVSIRSKACSRLLLYRNRRSVPFKVRDVLPEDFRSLGFDQFLFFSVLFETSDFGVSVS
jgi:hypothetical protein